MLLYGMLETSKADGEGLGGPEEEESYDDADGDVEEGGQRLSTFEGFDGFGAEGGERREGSAEACGEEEHGVARDGGVTLSQACEEAEEYAAKEIDHEGADGERQQAKATGKQCRGAERRRELHQS